jgi:hypothetical protein
VAIRSTMVAWCNTYRSPRSTFPFMNGTLRNGLAWTSAASNAGGLSLDVPLDVSGDCAETGPERTARRIILADARIIIRTSIKSQGLVMFTYEQFIPDFEYKKYFALSVL